MNKLAKAICKHKKIILLISLILLIPALIGMKATKINYDILVYLPENVETIQGEKILSEDFNMGRIFSSNCRKYGIKRHFKIRR